MKSTAWSLISLTKCTALKIYLCKDTHLKNLVDSKQLSLVSCRLLHTKRAPFVARSRENRGKTEPQKMSMKTTQSAEGKGFLLDRKRNPAAIRQTIEWLTKLSRSDLFVSRVLSSVLCLLFSNKHAVRNLGVSSENLYLYKLNC